MGNKLNEIKEYKSNKLREIKVLQNKQLELQKELNNYLDNEISQIEYTTWINKNDCVPRCNSYKCNMLYCISPCKNCYHSLCHQCIYGYKNLVDQLIKKYTIEELEELKDKCPYALISYIKSM